MGALRMSQCNPLGGRENGISVVAIRWIYYVARSFRVVLPSFTEPLQLSNPMCRLTHMFTYFLQVHWIGYNSKVVRLKQCSLSRLHISPMYVRQIGRYNRPFPPWWHNLHLPLEIEERKGIQNTWKRHLCTVHRGEFPLRPLTPQLP